MTQCSEKPTAISNMRVFVSCQIDVVNKQLVYPLSWNNPLSKTSLGELYILMICRHLDGKEKHSFNAYRV